MAARRRASRRCRLRSCRGSAPCVTFAPFILDTPGRELVQMYQIPDTGGISMHGRLGFRDLAATGLALLLLAAGVTVGIGAASAGPSGPGWGSSAGLVEPNDDPFYRPPTGFESAAPGTVLATRPVSV